MARLAEPELCGRKGARGRSRATASRFPSRTIWPPGSCRRFALRAVRRPHPLRLSLAERFPGTRRGLDLPRVALAEEDRGCGIAGQKRADQRVKDRLGMIL